MASDIVLGCDVAQPANLEASEGSDVASNHGETVSEHSHPVCGSNCGAAHGEVEISQPPAGKKIGQPLKPPPLDSECRLSESSECVTQPSNHEIEPAERRPMQEESLRVTNLADLPFAISPTHSAASVTRPQMVTWRNTIRAQYLNCTRQSGSELDRRLLDRMKNLRRSEPGMLFCCQTPFQATINGRYFQILAGLLVLAWVWMIMSSQVMIEELLTHQAKVVRFTTLAGNLTQTGIEEFGVLSDQCGQHTATVISQQQAVVSFNESVRMTGWFLRKNEVFSLSEPFEFRIEASDDGDSWKTLAENQWCRGIAQSGGGAHPSSALIQADFVKANWLGSSCAWPFQVYWIWQGCFACLLLCAVMYLGWSGKTALAKKVCVYGWLFLLFLGYASAVGFHINGRQEQVFFAAGGVTGYLVFPIGLVVRETRFLELAVVHGLILLSFDLLNGLFYPGEFEFPGHSVSALFLIFVPVGFICYRERTRMRVTSATKGDCEEYDEVFESLLSDKETTQQLERLEELCTSIHAKCLLSQKIGYAEYGQLVQQVSENLASNSESEGEKWFGDLIYTYKSPFFSAFVQKCTNRSLIKSLDQLFYQAAAVQPILKEKIEGWCEDFQKTKLLLEGIYLNRVRFSQLKSTDRAIEKVARCFGGEVFKLLDIARQELVFDTVSDLADFLQIISMDTDVELLRIKDRLRPSWDSKQSGGFRHVVLNARLITEEVKDLGLDGHIFELQLMLSSFSERRNSEKHARYVAMRHSRAFVNYGAPALVSVYLYLSNLFKMSKEKRSPERMKTSLLFSGTTSLRSDSNATTPSHSNVKSPTNAELRFLQASRRLSRPYTGSDSTSKNNDGSVDFSREDLHQQWKNNMIEVILLQRYRWPCNILDQMLTEVQVAFKLARTESVFFSSTPIIAALSKPWIQLLLMVLGLYYAFVLPGQISNFLADYSVSAQQYRIRPLRLERNGTFVPIHNNESIESFSLLLDGCEVEGSTNHTVSSDGDVSVTFERPTKMNGFVVHRSSRETENSSSWPISVQLDVSKDGQSWERIWYGECNEFMSDLQVSVPCAASKPHKNKVFESPQTRHYSMKLPWYGALVEVMYNVMVPVTMIGSSLLGFSGRSAWARALFIFTWLCLSAMYSVAAWCDILEGTGHVAMFWYLNGVVYGSLAILFRFLERFVLQGIVLLSILYYLSDVIRFQMAYNEMNLGCVECLTGALCGILFLVARTWTLYRSERNIFADQQRYSATWDSLVASDRFEKALTKIEKMTVKWNQHRAEPRQTECSGQRNWVTTFRPQDKMTGLPLQIGQEIESLDQLYAIAAGVYPILMIKLQKWASRAEGFFPIQDPDSDKSACGLWKRLKKDPRLRDMVKWANLKPVDRAIEKLARSYGGQVSRLLDVCRQFVIFESLGDIVHCMEIIGGDTDVEILRVKNRMAEEYDFKKTAGFRSVLMNIRIVTEETKSLRLDGHVCEIQLVPKQIFDLKGAAGHARYINFRNSRGQ